MSVSVAFIGLKGHEYVVLDATREMPEVKIAAVADDNPEALKRVLDFPGACDDTRTYLDYRELLSKHRPDIVVEAGIDRDRADVLMSCAERGIHLISEKPVAKDLEGLERVVKAITNSGVKHTALLQMRCSPPFLAMREAVTTGAVGEVTQGGGQKSYRLGERPAWQKSRETFSGIIPFVGIHVIDLFRWTSGRELVEVMAYAANTGHPEMGDLEDNACVIGRLDNGGSAAFRLDYCRPAAAPTHGDDRVRVAGSKGVVEVMHEQAALITHEEPPRELPLPDPVNLFADYLEAIDQDRDPFIPFAECVRSTEVVLRAREAAETGRPVAIPEA
jgi:predicted dehydrogenase